MTKEAFISEARGLLGTQNVLTDASKKEPFETDARRRFKGNALAVLLPATTEEVSQCMLLCARHGVSVVAQGGNSSLVLGAVPDSTGKSVVLSLKRMNKILETDTLNMTMTVEAGCVLSDIREAARQKGLYFPLNMASSLSCTIGGNLASNAGGTAVLRYGTARAMALGIRAVMADGSVYDDLHKLRKNNTGYSVRDLLIGSEGTLGIITAATLRLFAKPAHTETLFVSSSSMDSMLSFLHLLQRKTNDVTAFELVSKYAMELVLKHFPDLRAPFAVKDPWMALVEMTGSGEHVKNECEELVSEALEQGMLSDAVIAQSEAHAKNFWSLRENISAAQAAETPNIKHDIAVPAPLFSSFIDETEAALNEAYPGCRNVIFGHLGDGSLHYNVGAPDGIDGKTFLKESERVNAIVYKTVNSYGGAISAEHGLGSLKHRENAALKSETEKKIMRAIKQALDPDNRLNPGRMIV